MTQEDIFEKKFLNVLKVYETNVRVLSPNEREVAYLFFTKGIATFKRYLIEEE